MNRHDDWEGRYPTGAEVSTMGLILPTDIMLGRGPTCYNNPGNRMLRKLIKEHVVHYKNGARRREKSALVKLLVSTLEAKGYRFLQRSSTGICVEFPSHLAEMKVGHGLRDARLSVGKTDDNVNVLPKNFRRAIAEQKHTDPVTPDLTGEAKETEEMQSETSDTTEVTTVSVDSQSNASPTKLQEIVKPVVVSSSARAIHRMQGVLRTFQEKDMHLVDANLPFFRNKLLRIASAIQEHPNVDERKENRGFSIVDCQMAECINHWDSTGHFNDIAEHWPDGFSSCVDSNWELGLGHRERSWDDINITLPDLSPSTGATFGAYDLDDMGFALKAYASAYGESSDTFFAGDPYHSLGYYVEDAHGLCRWFTQSSFVRETVLFG